jgi:4,5-dihydroxyphthalate decarboxylase
MSRVKLTIATTDYDHFRDFRLGIVSAEGIDHTWLTLGHHEVFARFTFNREWEVSELSFAKFCAQVTRKTPDIIGLPVVCSRLFRFSSFYVNRRSKIKTAADLKGRTIGSPEWAHTAAVYMRGWLNDEHGIGLRDVHWYQAGANEPGRVEKVELDLPKGVKLTRVNDKSLSEMIASGEIDCALIARPPNSFLQGHPDVVRLFPNYLEMEEAYYEQTKVWPIMHIITIQDGCSTSIPGSRAISTMPSSSRSAAAWSACSIPRSRAIRSPGFRPMRARCATCSTATLFLTASKRTGRRWSSFCATPASRGSRTGTPRPRRFFPRAS